MGSRLIVAAAVAGAAGALTLAPSALLANNPGGPCATPTRAGTAGDNVINGTASADIIDAKGGDDTIRALGGDDIICPGSGQDFVKAGGGDDTVVEIDLEFDVVYAGADDDEVHLNDSDEGHGGGGHDSIEGGWLLFGDDGSDNLEPEGAVVGCSPDCPAEAYGGGGDDRIESIQNNAGLDNTPSELFGQEGDDVLWGSRITTMEDNLHGGSGSDYMNGRASFDFCGGGDGIDEAFNCESTSSVP